MKVEVKEAQSNEVDWTKNPQLVVSNIGEIVLTKKVRLTETDNFEGFVIGFTKINSSSLSLGYYDSTWFKTSFKPFHGEITLKND